MSEESMNMRLQAFETTITTLSKKIDKLIDSLPDRYCSKELCISKMDDLERRVDLLEQQKNNAVWALIVAVLSVLWSFVRGSLGF